MPKVNSLFCPKIVIILFQITSWPAEAVYGKLAKMCFVADPMKRASFSDLVQELENVLNCKEKKTYLCLSNQYINIRSPISKSGTPVKSAEISNKQQAPTYSKKYLVANNEFNESYLNMTQNLNPKNSQFESQKTPLRVGGNNLLPIDGIGQQNTPTDYVMVYDHQLSPSHKMIQDCDKLDSVIIGSENTVNNSLNPSQSNLFPSSDNGYITIEAANHS